MASRRPSGAQLGNRPCPRTPRGFHAAAFASKPQDRIAGLRALVEKVGGKLESMDFCLGDYDTHVMCTLPDDKAATAGIIKDAGDDPDVTHGALICATVRAGLPRCCCASSRIRKA